MAHPPSIDLQQVAKALIAAEISVRAKGKDVEIDKIRDLIFETNDHYVDHAKALLPFLEELVRTANSEGYSSGYADGTADGRADSDDPRRKDALFNDITGGPDWLNLSERQRLADHLWHLGWRREVRPEDITERRDDDWASKVNRASVERVRDLFEKNRIALRRRPYRPEERA